MLMVAPTGKTNLVTRLSIPKFSSRQRKVTGNVPALMIQEKENRVGRSKFHIQFLFHGTMLHRASTCVTWTESNVVGSVFSSYFSSALWLICAAPTVSLDCFYNLSQTALLHSFGKDHRKAWLATMQVGKLGFSNPPHMTAGFLQWLFFLPVTSVFFFF